MKNITDAIVVKSTTFRISSITHFDSGSTVVDSFTTMEFESVERAMDYITSMVSDFIKGNKSMSMKWTFDTEDGINNKCHLLINGKAFVDYEINALDINMDGSLSYRGMVFNYINEDKTCVGIILDKDYLKGITRYLSIKNTVNECIMFVDQFSVTSFPYTFNYNKSNKTSKRNNDILVS